MLGSTTRFEKSLEQPAESVCPNWLFALERDYWGSRKMIEKFSIIFFTLFLLKMDQSWNFMLKFYDHVSNCSLGPILNSLTIKLRNCNLKICSTKIVFWSVLCTFLVQYLRPRVSRENNFHLDLFFYCNVLACFQHLCYRSPSATSPV